MFLRQPHISSTKCEDRWMTALLQQNKKDATEYNASKNIVGDIFDWSIFFMYDRDPLKRRE